MKSFEASFRNSNFSPSTSVLLNYFFPFIDIAYFFPSLMSNSRVAIYFQKRRWSCDFPPRKTPVAQKHRAISRQEKLAFSSPRRVVLGLPSTSPRVCTGGRTGVRSRHNQNFSDRWVTNRRECSDELAARLVRGVWPS